MAAHPAVAEWFAEMSPARREAMRPPAPDLIIVYRQIEPRDGKFTCFVDGWLHQLTPAEILAAAERGTTVREDQQ